MRLALFSPVISKLKNSSLCLTFVFAALSFSGSVSARDVAYKNQAHQFLVQMETKENPMAETSSEPLRLESVLIPIRLIEKSDFAHLPAEVHRVLFIRRDGKEYYRWIFHPDDTQYRHQVINDLRQNLQTGEDLLFDRSVLSYRMGSRSLQIMDAQSTFLFSLKTSTNQAGGQWADKAQPVRYAESAMLASNHVREMEREYGQFEFAVPLYEPGAVYNRRIDQAQIFRLLDDVNTGTKRYLPLFSMLSATVMQQLMTANKMTMGQVIEHIGFIWSRAQTEWVMKTGLSTSSAHAQNFLIELDPLMRFTGRLIFRDFADAHVMYSFLRGPYREKILQHWNSLHDSSNQIFKRSLSINFMPYHGLGMQIEDQNLLRIFDGIRAGIRSQMKRDLGAWGLPQWDVSESSMDGSTGLLVTAKPKAAVDTELVLELIRRKGSGIPACRFVHSFF